MIESYAKLALFPAIVPNEVVSVPPTVVVFPDTPMLIPPVDPTPFPMLIAPVRVVLSPRDRIPLV